MSARAEATTSCRIGALVLALAVAAGLLTATSSSVAAAAGDISTIAGSLGEGPALGVAQQPSGLALRGSSLYISDPRAGVIRVLDLSTGLERVIAGNGPPGGRGDGGQATAAELVSPEGIDMDAAGNLYVADAGGGTIRRMAPSGIITKVAGGGSWHHIGDGGPATAAGLSYPTDVAVDGAGQLYIADYFNHRVRKVSAAGIITTIAGNGTKGFGGDGGPATAAMLERPSGVAVDAAGNVFVADSFNNRVRKVDTAGTITTVAGSGATGLTGDGGPATTAAIYEPERVEVGPEGHLYVAQSRAGAVRKVDAAGIITTVLPGGGGAGRLGQPVSMVFDADRNLYVAGIYFFDYRVHKVTPAGVMSTVAGNGTPSFSGDGGPAVAAQLGQAPRVAFGPGGDLYVADLDNDRVRRIDGAGRITSVATADFNIAGAIVFDRAGNLYVAEPAVIRRIDPAGRSTVVAGTGATGFTGDGGPATSARISYPSSLALDGAGNLYLADSENDRVRRVDPSGVITTVAGGGPGYLGDGGPATAATLDLFLQSGIAVSSQGQLFLADTYNNRIRTVGVDGIITTVAGTGGNDILGEGRPAVEADVYHPGGLAFDGADNLYLVDIECRVRKVDGAGIITTVAGNGTCGNRGDGGPATQAEIDLNAGNQAASNLAVDPAGNLVIGVAHRVRRVAGVAVAVPALPTTTSTSTSTSPSTSTSTSTSTTVPALAPARARAWGLNNVGELGDGTTADAPAPRGGGTVAGATQVSAGWFHSAARRDDGTVWTWGWNGYGQLGDGTTVDRLTPVQVPGISNVRSVLAGATHTVALREDGTLWAWGWNGVGQLGNGTTADRRAPVQVSGLTNIVQLAAGGFHNLALRADGTVWSWGFNDYGQLGPSPVAGGLTPSLVTGLGPVRSLAAGGYHSLALMADGTVQAWGSNAYGQLGRGSTVDSDRPGAVTGLSEVTSLAGGLLHSVASRRDGTVRASGWNGVGQLGDGTTVDRTSPTVTGPLGPVQEVAAGVFHSLALGSSGSVTAWGWNAYGQLGDGTTLDRHRPTARPLASGAFGLSGGAAHTVALVR